MRRNIIDKPRIARLALVRKLWQSLRDQKNHKDKPTWLDLGRNHWSDAYKRYDQLILKEGSWYFKPLHPIQHTKRGHSHTKFIKTLGHVKSEGKQAEFSRKKGAIEWINVWYTMGLNLMVQMLQLCCNEIHTLAVFKDVELNWAKIHKPPPTTTHGGGQKKQWDERSIVRHICTGFSWSCWRVSTGRCQ